MRFELGFLSCSFLVFSVINCRVEDSTIARDSSHSVASVGFCSVKTVSDNGRALVAVDQRQRRFEYLRF